MSHVLSMWKFPWNDRLCLDWSVCVSWFMSPLAVWQHLYVFVKQTAVCRNPTTQAPQLLCHCQILSAALTFCHWLCLLGCQIEGGLYQHSSHPVCLCCQGNYADLGALLRSSLPQSICAILCFAWWKHPILSSSSSFCPSVTTHTRHVNALYTNAWPAGSSPIHNYSF